MSGLRRAVKCQAKIMFIVIIGIFFAVGYSMDAVDRVRKNYRALYQRVSEQESRIQALEDVIKSHTSQAQ